MAEVDGRPIIAAFLARAGAAAVGGLQLSAPLSGVMLDGAAAQLSTALIPQMEQKGVGVSVGTTKFLGYKNTHWIC